MVQALSKCSSIVQMFFNQSVYVFLLSRSRAYTKPSSIPINNTELTLKANLFILLIRRTIGFTFFVSIITIVTRDGRTFLSLSCDHGITRKATRCNYHDGLPNVCFILKMSMFSEVYLESSQTSMMELFWKNS